MRKFNKYFLFIFFSIIIIGTYLFLNKKSYWEEKSNFIIVKYKDGEVSLVSYNPANKTITTLDLDENDVIDSAYNYGEWKIGSLWELGFSEGLKGDLLSKSITKSLNIPVDAWEGEKRSNISFFDKLKLKKFEASVKTKDKLKGDLDDIYQFASSQAVSEESQKIGIFYSTSRNNEEVSNVVDVLGAKVLSMQKANLLDTFDCEIVSKEKNITAKKISQTLGCNLVIKNFEENLDIKIILGNEFSNLF